MEISNEIICPLCKHLLTKPVLLACCLTATCYGCLKKISYRSDSLSGEIYYNCPFCKKDHENLETVTASNFLQEYLNYLSKKGKPEFIICDRCDKDFGLEEVLICYCCDERVFCSSCNEILHSTGKYIEHTRKPYHINKIKKEGETYLSCKNHIKEKIEFVCMKDMSMLCNYCLASHKQACKSSHILKMK